MSFSYFYYTPNQLALHRKNRNNHHIYKHEHYEEKNATTYLVQSITNHLT